MILKAEGLRTRRVLVTGTPRSGTSYFTKLLNQYNLKLGHECVGEGGTVSGFFFVDHDWYPYGHYKASEKLGQFDFKVLIRLVRDPLKTIPSLAELLKRQYRSANNSYQDWYPDVGIITHKDKLLWSSLNVWVQTHTLIQNEDITLKLETIEEQWPSLQNLLGIKEEFRNIPVPNRSFKVPATTWDKLEKEDKVLAEKAHELAKGFGY